MRHLGVLTCSLILLFGLSAAAQSLDSDEKELKNYTLTMATLKQFAAASRAMATAMNNDPRYREVAALKKQLETLENKEEPSDTELDRMEKLREEIEAAEERMGAGLDLSDGQTLSDMEADIRKIPVLANALKSVGMAPREYAKFALAFFQASMLHGFQQSGMVKQIPKELEAKINMENVKFVAEHQEEIKALTAELQALGKP